MSAFHPDSEWDSDLPAGRYATAFHRAYRRCSAATWTSAVRAQSDQVRRIGIIRRDDPETLRRVTALREALVKLGWTDGRNIRFEHR